MKKSVVAVLFIFFISVVQIYAQQKIDKYEEYWRKVYQFELKEQTKSAAAVADTIFLLAKKEGKQPHFIKSLIYKSKFMLVLQEEAQLEIVNQLKTEIATAPFPMHQILESILANLYWQYFKENRWRINNRTHTDEKVDSTDFRTWDNQTILTEIDQLFRSSLQNKPGLQKTNLSDFNYILEGEDASKIYRPTLFDFLSHNALNFYTDTERGLSQPTDQFLIDDSTYFQNFMAVLPTVKDSLSLQYQALLLYRDLLAFHQKDTSPNAFVMVALERFHFVRNNSILQDEEAHYEKALLQLKASYATDTISTEIEFEIAKFYDGLADSYDPAINQENRFKRKEALDICQKAIERFPQSIGAQNCQELQDKILLKTLNILTEKYIPINQAARLLIEYKNIDTLYFQIYKVSAEEQSKFAAPRTDSTVAAFFKGKNLLESWQSVLRNEGDYQRHKTEIVLPALQQGSYLVVAKPTKETIQQSQKITTAFIQVTNLILVEDKFYDDNFYRFQVVNRNTGAPVKNAKIRFKTSNQEMGNNNFDQSFTSDQNGFFQLQANKYYYNLEATITTENDLAVFEGYYLDGDENNEKIEKSTIPIYLKPYLFTDRSIYRPGQTVYFKGILTKRQGNRTEVVSGEYVEVYMEDVNGQEIETFRLKTNQFGSFSGEFILPKDGITGEYIIYVEEDIEEDSKLYDELMEDFEWLEHTIRVEEYKRPKFEAQFEPVTATYRVHDTITVNGVAQAFAGSNITEAKVSYRVQRKAQFAPWYFWSHPERRYSYNSDQQEINYGETTTDADGHFSIQFKAVPDEEISKEDLPVFNYEITADITDVNGETHSATTVVNVGYHTLSATIQVPEAINKTSAETRIPIITQNLNNEFVPTQGTIKIYKLQAPEQVLRSRPWEAPDYQILSRSVFKELFPHDPYENEDNPENWKKSEPILTFNFDTGDAKEIVIKNTKKWTSGQYFIELECEDKFRNPVVDKHFFTLFSPEDPSPADQALFSITSDKTSYRKGETAKIKIGSASQDLTVTLDVLKNREVVSTQLVHLQNNFKTIEIPITNQEADAWFVQYSFVNYNEFKNGTLDISIINSSPTIAIETASFRDKLQPGEEQTWSFTVKGNNTNRVVAEVLAGMYDASLDQFSPHAWAFPQENSIRYFGYNRSNAGRSFSVEGFISNNLFNNYGAYHSYQQVNFDRFKWFGFSFTNNSYINRQYLNGLAATAYFSSIHSSNDTRKEKGFIYGTIKDEKGEVLPGVNILIKGTKKGTISDIDGKYAIQAKQGDELVFAFIGYQSVAAEVGDRNIINARLVADVQKLEEVVVVGYGTQKRQSLTGSIAEVTFDEAVMEEIDLDLAINGKVAGLTITESVSNASLTVRGNSTLSDISSALIVVDGKIVENFELDKNEIASIEVLKDEAATALYGARAANGLVVITTKEGQKKLDMELAQVNARKNLQETAFFFPHLTTNRKGEVSFNFTAPEALTRWKLQLLAHTREVLTATKTLTAVTQKSLMVMPNPPRFLRQGDEIVFSAKISNLTTDSLSGFAALQLSDAITENPVDDQLQNLVKNQSFTIDAQGNTQVSWLLTIPENLQALQYKIVAKAGDFSDGEQNSLPILPNRMLVTETLPMWIRADQTKTFTLNKLKENQSPTLKNHQLTLEITSNPAWYAIRALPYMMEFPYECAEQTFSRYYANALASFMVNANPRVKEVFEQWSAGGNLTSNLEKNEELKSIIIQETPWHREAESESEQQKRIALLFDLNTLQGAQSATLAKLQDMQFSNGGFPWFQGSTKPNRYITQHIATGFGHLMHLTNNQQKTPNWVESTVQYLDKQLVKDYQELLKEAAKIRENAQDKKEGLNQEKDYLEKNHITPIQLHYLYMRSFFPEAKADKELQTAIDYYLQQTVRFWKEQSIYLKGMIALIQHRKGNEEIPQAILVALEENSITSEESGMYWKENKAGWYWYAAPVEVQSLLIEAFSEITMKGLTANEQQKMVDELRVWLLKHKQTNQWPSTKATTEAVYAILLQGSDLISDTENITVQVGGQSVDPNLQDDVQMEAGTGYFKASWHTAEITPDMGTVQLSKPGKGIGWGALYWQYFEDLDKITTAETQLLISKKLFLKKNTDSGEQLTAINDQALLHLGDLVRVRIELKVDREMDFVHMKDMRASGLEPISVLSEYKWQDGLGYYESTRDASTNFFFEHLKKGVYVFEYDLRVNNKGNFSNGITTIQCMYAPEFSSHSEGVRIAVE